MKLEVGKRYVLRNGEVTGKLLPNGTCMSDGVLGVWTSTGHDYNAQEQSEFDIVAEYVEPQPQQPLRWVENCKPDKPGIWAWVVDNGMFEATWISGPSSISECVIGTWCYLGPIPEILPPKKKVVERLWLEVTEYIEGEELCRLHWFDDATNPEDSEGDWYKTDRTREREI